MFNFIKDVKLLTNVLLYKQSNYMHCSYSFETLTKHDPAFDYRN